MIFHPKKALIKKILQLLAGETKPVLLVLVKTADYIAINKFGFEHYPKFGCNWLEKNVTF